MRWEVKPLGEVCKIEMGQSPPSDTYNSEGKGEPLINGPVEFGPKPFSDTVMKKWTTAPKKFCAEGDVILCVRGSTTGRMNIAGFDAAIGRGCAAIRYDRNPMWLAFFIRLMGEQILNSGTGSTFPNFSSAQLSALSFPIPPLDEQEHIVEVLDEAFAAIDKAKANIERNLTNARELFQSRLNDIFSNPSEDWEVRPLGEIARRVCVGHVGSTSKYYVDEGGVPFFRTGDLKNEYLSLPASKSIQAEFHEKLVKSQLNANDLVISRVISERVICSIVPSGIAQANCANVVIAKIGDEQSAKFLSAQLSSKNSQDYFLGNKVGSAQQVVNTKILSAWPVLWPPHDEQKKIITELDTFRDLRKTLEVHYQTELDNLEELRQSILEQAFEGKLTEPVAA